MRRIKKQEEPVFWTEYKKAHPKEQYRDLKETEEGNALRRNMREHLVRSQYGLCAYCCRSIDVDHSLNEHIRPQAGFPNQTMDYQNLAASCKSEGLETTCGVKKGNHYDEDLFVSPLEENCEREFLFYPNGEIEGAEERGEYTCKILNLNSYELQKARKAQYKICASYRDAEMIKTYFLTPAADGTLEAYADMIQYFYERGDFGIIEKEI